MLVNKNSVFGLVKVHVLPREMLGKSTFGLSMWLLKWLPMRLVDRFLLMVSWLMLGDTSELGLDRPCLGPLELKNMSGKTPVLDVGTLAKIKGGDIKVLPFLSNQFQLSFLISILTPQQTSYLLTYLHHTHSYLFSKCCCYLIFFLCFSSTAA